MSAYDYTEQLPASFDSNKVIESLKASTKQLAKLREQLETMGFIFNNPELATEDFKSVNEAIINAAKGSKWFNFRNQTVGEILDTLLDTTTHLSIYAETEIRTKFGKEVGNVGLTYNKAYLLQTVEVIEFISLYTTRYIDTFTATIVDKLYNKNDSVSPGDVEYIKTHLIEFTVIVKTYLKAKKDLVKLIDAVPDIIVTTEESGVRSVVGSANLDPMGITASLPWPISTIFSFRLIFANMQMNKYEYDRETAKTVERRIMLIEQKIANGEGDAGLEKALSVQEARLAKLKRNIEKVENKYGKS